MNAPASEPDLAAAGAAVRERLPWEPELFLVLGSGLGGLADAIPDPVSIPFASVPGFPSAGVAGHQGRYIAGELEGRRVLMQAGRFHFYEGYGAGLVTAPVRIAAALGARTAIFTNAAGGIRRSFEPGTIMLIDDHLNLQWRSALAGPVREGEERFPDMSAPYDPELQALALRAAAHERIPLARGVYAAVLGPSYETPAEVRMLVVMGADAVGMSTVPEVIAARAVGLRVLAFSLITNPAAGLRPVTLSHDDVLEVGARAGESMERIVRGVLRRLPEPGACPESV